MNSGSGHIRNSSANSVNQPDFDWPRQFRFGQDNLLVKTPKLKRQSLTRIEPDPNTFNVLEAMREVKVYLKHSDV